MGHQPEELTAILITHGHGDHWGEAGYFKNKYGCDVYMSEIDYTNFATHVPPEFPWKSLDYPMTGYLEEMGTCESEVQIWRLAFLGKRVLCGYSRTQQK